MGTGLSGLFEALKSGELEWFDVPCSEDSSVRIALRNRGDIIEDPDCENDFQVLQGGIFKRCVKISGDVESYVYLRMGPPILDTLEDVVRDVMRQAGHVEREFLPLQIALSKMAAEKARSRSIGSRSI